MQTSWVIAVNVNNKQKCKISLQNSKQLPRKLQIILKHWFLPHVHGIAVPGTQQFYLFLTMFRNVKTVQHGFYKRQPSFLAYKHFQVTDSTVGPHSQNFLGKS